MLAVRSKVLYPIANIHTCGIQRKDLKAKNKGTKDVQNSDFSEFLNRTEETLLDPVKKELTAALRDVAFSGIKPGLKKEKRVVKPRPPIMDIKNLKFPHSKLFSNPVKGSGTQYKDVQLFSDQEKDEMKRLYFFQECLANESPGKCELKPGVNQQNFFNPPTAWERQVIPSYSMNKKRLLFFMQKWSLKNKKGRKQVKKALSKQSQPEKVNKKDYVPGLLPRLNIAYIRKWGHGRAMAINPYIQPVVVDMRFHKEIDASSSSLITQLDYMYSRNMSSPHPFHLVFCNFDQTTPFYKVSTGRFSKYFHDVCTITDKSYTDMEPLINCDNLVYLSPDAPDVMTELCHEKVYIIGGLVDKVFEGQLTRTISKGERLNSERLPLQLYLKWGGVGGKAELSLNVVFDILMTLKQTGSWIEALRHIPYRLHRGLTEMGKELAGFDEQIISDFSRGQRWVDSKGEIVPPPFCSIQSRVKKYLGKY